MNFEDPRFEPILRRFQGRHDLAKRVLSAFVSQAEEDMAVLTSAVFEGDREQIRRIAHRIKGAAANAGVESMRLHSERIEALSRDGNLSDCPAHLHGLIEAWRDLTRAFEGAEEIGKAEVGA